MGAMAGFRAGTVLAAALLAGCAAMSPPEDDLEAKLASYYAAHAVEEDGLCKHPQIDSITHRKVLQSNAERTVLRVRYSYFDAERGSTKWRLVLDRPRECTGFAERDFTLENRKLGFTVIGMSGPDRME